MNINEFINQFTDKKGFAKYQRNILKTIGDIYRWIDTKEKFLQTIEAIPIINQIQIIAKNISECENIVKICETIKNIIFNEPTFLFNDEQLALSEEKEILQYVDIKYKLSIFKQEKNAQPRLLKKLIKSLEIYSNSTQLSGGKVNETILKTIYDKLVQATTLEKISQWVKDSLIELNKITCNIVKTKFIKKVKRFDKKYKKLQTIQYSEKLYAPLILEKQAYEQLTTEDWQWLWEHVNKEKLASLIIKHYNIEEFKPFTSLKHVDLLIDYCLLESLVFKEKQVIQLTQYNKIRKKLNLPSYIPPGYFYPSLDYAPQTMPAEEAFQYTEQELICAEHILRQSYPHIIYNKDNNNKVLAHSPYYFYLISSYNKELVFPEIRSATTHQNNYNHQTYHDSFVTALQSLIINYNPRINTQKIIFAGVVNVNGNHYISYFIYKNVDEKIFVITVDPSPWLIKSKNLKYNKKLKNQLALEKCFKEIFPDCHYQDAGITQQYGERSCGDSALTTLEDAFSTTTNTTSLLTLDNNDNLCFHKELLSLNADNDCHIDDHDYYFYSFSFIQKCQNNRSQWREKFITIKTLTSYIPEASHALTIDTPETVTSLGDYDHIATVAEQNIADKNDSLYSTISAVLVEDIDFIKERFLRSLSYITEDERKILTSKINQIRTDKLMISLPQERPLIHIIEAIIKINLYPYIEEALQNSFNQFIENFDKNIVITPSTTQQNIIDAFLTDKRKTWLIHLNLSNQDQLRKQWIEKIATLLPSKQDRVCVQEIEKYLTEKILPAIQTGKQLIPDFKEFLTYSDCPVFQAANFLIEHFPSSIDKLIVNFSENAAQRICQKISSSLLKNININYLSYSECMGYWDSKNEQFILFTFENRKQLIALLNDTLPENLPHENELITFATYIDKTINCIFNKHIESRLQEIINHESEKFCQIASIQNSLSIERDEIISLLDESNGLLSKLISSFFITQKYDTEIESFLQFEWCKSIFIHCINQHLKSQLEQKLLNILEGEKNALIKHFFQMENPFAVDENDKTNNYDALLQAYYQNSDHCTYLINKIKQTYNDEIVKSVNQLLEEVKKFKSGFNIFHKIVKQAEMFSTTKLVEESFFNTMNENLSQLNTAENPMTELSEKLWPLFFEKYLSFCKTLFNENYKQGSLNPNASAGYYRPLLCQLLDIDSLPILIVRAKTAKRIDMKINAKLAELAATEASYQRPLINPVVRLAKIEDNYKKFPFTYGQPLTLNIIIHCIYYWRFKQKDPEKSYPEEIEDIIIFINGLKNPELDQPLSQSFYNYIYALLNKSLKAISFFEDQYFVKIRTALMVTVPSDHKSTAKKETCYIHLLTINDIEKVFTSYIGEGEHEKIKRSATQDFFASTWGKVYKYAGISHAMQDLIKFIYNTRQRHQDKKNNFVLDDTDRQALFQILYNRLKSDFTNIETTIKVLKLELKLDDPNIQGYSLLLRKLVENNIIHFFNQVFPKTLKQTCIPPFVKTNLPEVFANYPTQVIPTIDDIPVDRLIYLEGYLLDANWMVDIYKKNNTLIHPYFLEDNQLTTAQITKIITQLSKENCQLLINHWESLKTASNYSGNEDSVFKEIKNRLEQGLPKNGTHFFKF